MSWLEKVKKVAGDATTQVQSKVEHAKTRKKADDAAKQLGYLVFRERTGGAAAGDEADKLVAEIKAAEEALAAAPEEPGEAPEEPGEAPEA
ncbi:MAG: hypothetical protein ACXWX0_05935 [Actinomycetota bacterium]